MTTDFEIYAGDDKLIEVAVLDKVGDPVSISGATIRWRASRSFGKAVAISKSTSSGISITDAANGEFQVTLTPSDTASLKGPYFHEAEVEFGDGKKSTVLQGRMIVNPILIST